MDLPIDVDVLGRVGCVTLSHPELLGQLLLSTHASLSHSSFNSEILILKVTYLKAQNWSQSVALKDQKEVNQGFSRLHTDLESNILWSLQSLC